MNSREWTKRIMRTLFPCLLALILVPAFAEAQNNKPKPALRPANNNASKAASARQVRPTTARPAKPLTSTPQSHSSGGITATKPITGTEPTTGTVGGGGTTGTKPTTGTVGSGGITGTKPTTGTVGSGGVTGAKPTTGTVGSGGITGTKPTTGTVGSGGITGTKPTNTFTAGRGGINGSNRTPEKPVYIPGRNMQTTNNADGTRRHYDSQTQTAIHTDRGGHIAAVERPGLRATGFREDGHAGHIEQSRADGSRMVVDRGVHGERKAEVVGRDGTRVVSAGRQGFVERPIRPGYVSRTYVSGDRTQVRVYRTSTFGGIHYSSYVPSVYYQPAFYGWANRPWGAPVAYGWGWGNAPWFYGGYFAPAPFYSSAALWLTDFVLAENLKLAYDNQMAASGQGQPEPQAPLAQENSAALTPEVKQLIADEVQQQLAAEQAAAAQPASLEPTAAVAVPDAPPPALDPRIKVFVVSTGLNLSAGSDGQTCALTPGDVIERTGRNVSADGQVPVGVLDSKEGDCPVDFASALDVNVLQDMYNDFRAQISAGLEKLASNRGQGGLPAGPAADPQPVPEGQAPALTGARGFLAKLAQDADQAEGAISQVFNGGQ